MSHASFASLSPTLLARKGAARPAMRPQVQPLDSQDLHGRTAAYNPHDDLGWNEMGDDAPETRPKADVIAFETGAPVGSSFADMQTEVAPRAKIAARLDRAAPRRKAIEKGRRAAFTLRIEPERHLKLRLACTLQNRSAQSLITDALDAYLETQDELAELAAQIGDQQRSN